MMRKKYSIGIVLEFRIFCDRIVVFDISKQWSETVSYSTHSYPKGKYRLQYRHVYKEYKVKQDKKYHPRAKTLETRYVYPKKWVERQYRVVKL
ncbi:hypothetical protein CEW92_10415 [Bacillaceae bacterium SAS-127]|nr:hypothetical protein CEW92_10415 [Bacillaceae bacterium SAS-127]